MKGRAAAVWRAGNICGTCLRTECRLSVVSRKSRVEANKLAKKVAEVAFGRLIVHDTVGVKWTNKPVLDR